MNIKPLKNKIVVSRIEGTKQTASGIILKTTEEPDRAKVEAIGPDVDELNVNDIVLINWNAAVKNGEYYIIPIDQVVFIYGD